MGERILSGKGCCMPTGLNHFAHIYFAANKPTCANWQAGPQEATQLPIFHIRTGTANGLMLPVSGFMTGNLTDLECVGLNAWLNFSYITKRISIRYRGIRVLQNRTIFYNIMQKIEKKENPSCGGLFLVDLYVPIGSYFCKMCTGIYFFLSREPNPCKVTFRYFTCRGF